MSKTHRKHPPMARPTWQDMDEMPPIKGLVLAGGQSARMGEDKGEIDYHGKPQREFAADLIAESCENTFISCRSDQTDTIGSTYSPLPDTFIDLGPFGALLSAFRSDPNTAWLVVACDLPLLDQTSIQQLIAARDPQKLATAFRNGEDAFPEPLVAVWEPRSYPVLLRYLGEGRCCPRKVLLNEEILLIDPVNRDVLSNANTPEEAARHGRT